MTRTETHMRWEPAWHAERPDERLKTALVQRVLGIESGDGSLHVQCREQGGSAVTRLLHRQCLPRWMFQSTHSGQKDEAPGVGLGLMAGDEVIRVRIGKVEARTRSLHSQSSAHCVGGARSPSDRATCA
jgi:hypothetical protein